MFCGSPEGQVKDFFLWSDLKCFLSCVYDLRTGEKDIFARLICLSSLIFLPSLKLRKKKEKKKRSNFSCVKQNIVVFF